MKGKKQIRGINKGVNRHMDFKKEKFYIRCRGCIVELEASEDA